MGSELYHCLFALTKVAPCFHSPSLPWFQLLSKLVSPKRFCLWDCSSFCSRAFSVMMMVMVFPSHLFLLLVCPWVDVGRTAKLVSSGWAAEAHDQSCCRTALLPLGHWLAVLFTWAFVFLWACLTLHELHGCFAFVFFSFNAHWSRTATSCSSALIYLSEPGKNLILLPCQIWSLLQLIQVHIKISSLTEVASQVSSLSHFSLDFLFFFFESPVPLPQLGKSSKL